MPVTTLPPPAGWSDTVLPRRHITVHVKENWEDDWIDIESPSDEEIIAHPSVGLERFKYLDPISLTLAASPGVSRVTFRYHAGRIKREDKLEFLNQPPIDPDRWFVRIAVTPTGGGPEYLLFIGHFSSEENDIGGKAVPARDVTINTIDQIPIDQHFCAYGLETILDRIPVSTSWCLNKAGDGASFTGPAAPFEIGGALVFNERFGVGLNDFGNRTNMKKSSPAGRDAYVFGGKLAGGSGSDPAPWSAYNIVEYLNAYFVPDWMKITIDVPDAGASSPPRSPNVWYALDKSIYRYDANGKSIRQVLDELISPRRGMGWRLRAVPGVEESGPGGEGFVIDVFTIVGADVVADDTILPANPDQVQVPGYTVLDRQVHYSTDDLTRYGMIRVVGEPVLTCFTVSFADGTLEKGWTADEEGAYETVAGTAAEKDAARKADVFHHVWTQYRIPRAWDWSAGDGEGGTKHTVNPQIDFSSANLTYDLAPSYSRDFGHRLHRILPLRKQQLLEDAEPEFRNMFAVIKGRDDKWQYVDRLTPPFRSCVVSSVDTEPGVLVRPEPNHALAFNHWEFGGGDTDLELSYALDYTKVAATVAIETDQRLTMEIELDDHDLALGKVKQIEVPDAAIWIVVPGTIIDVNADGTLNHYAGTPIIRDDGARIRQIAAMAKAFYGVPRSRLAMVIDDLYTELRIGMYITELMEDIDGARTRQVNTVVTEMTFDLQEMTTSIETNFHELDVKFRARGSNSIANVPILDAAVDRQVVLAGKRKVH
jgi:hypothetical protein